MLKFTGKIIFEGVSKKTGPAVVSTVEHKRDFATTTDWSQEIRVEKPIKKLSEVPKYTVYDRQTGYEIMHPRDISGYNHMLFVDKTYQHDMYYMVRGCFTSSKNSINGITPEEISKVKFDGKKESQYFLRYPTPKLIRKADVKTAKLDVFDTMDPKKVALKTEDHRKFASSVEPIEKDIY